MSKQRKKDDEDLSPLQDKFLKAYMQSGNATDAAEVACKVKNRKSAASRGHQLMKELDRPIKELAKKAGLSRVKVVRAIDRGMDADQVHIFHNPKTGEIVEHRTPDWAARARFVDLFCKVFGEYEKQQMELPFDPRGEDGVVYVQFATATSTENAA